MERIIFVILTTAVTMARLHPQSVVDEQRIYTPDDIDELRAAIAYEECLRTPGCDPQPRCQVGSGGAMSLLKDMVDVRTNVGCNSMAGEVLWPATGQCVQLLTQGPCQPGHWVKLSNPEFEPVCALQPCREGQALMGGRVCHTMEDRTACPNTQHLLTNEFGEGECDCDPGLVYHQPTNACYTPYTQGPCNTGQVIKVIDAGASGRAECTDNLCTEPSTVPFDADCTVSTRMGPSTKCHTLGDQGPCESGFLTIDELLSEPVCLETHSIFNLPNTKMCPRGSKRDTVGRCRRNLALTFNNLPPVVTSRPRPHPNGRLCPSGQVLLAGTCMKLALSSRT